MRLGLVAYADNSGLGNLTKMFYDNIHFDKVMVIDRSGSEDRKFYPERYPNSMIVAGAPSMPEIDEFLVNLDLVLMFEVAPTYYLLTKAKEVGIKTVIIPMYEYFHQLFNPKLPRPDLYIAPSRWHLEDYPSPTVFIQIPIVSDPASKPAYATNFLHMAGKPVNPDRNGTSDLCASLEYVKSRITLTIRCLDADYIHNLLPRYRVPENVRLKIETNDVDSFTSAYINQHVLIMPRRYGGLCMPVNEALGFGMPVIMPDISPNNKWLPPQWLVKANLLGTRKIQTTFDFYESDHKEIAELIDRFAVADFYTKSVQVANSLATKLSWENQRPLYLKTFKALILRGMNDIITPNGY